MPWNGLLLLVRQRNPLLRHKATPDSFKSAKIFTIDVTLDVTLNVPWRWLLAGSLLLKLTHVVGTALSSVHHTL